MLTHTHGHRSPQGRDRRRSLRALTMVELGVVIVVVGLLGLLMLAALRSPRVATSRVFCPNNLKQISVAFRLFAIDNEDRLPAQVGTNEGGAKEYEASVYQHVNAARNELGTPKVLICPQDSRRAAANFAALGDANISYFLNLDAHVQNPEGILCGDRNFTLDGKAVTSVLVSISNRHTLSWTKTQHKRKGYAVFVDGSVRELKALSLTTNHLGANVVNRLAIP